MSINGDWMCPFIMAKCRRTPTEAVRKSCILQLRRWNKIIIIICEHNRTAILPFTWQIMYIFHLRMNNPLWFWLFPTEKIRKFFSVWIVSNTTLLIRYSVVYEFPKSCNVFYTCYSGFIFGELFSDHAQNFFRAQNQLYNVCACVFMPVTILPTLHSTVTKQPFNSMWRTTVVR